MNNLVHKGNLSFINNSLRREIKNHEKKSLSLCARLHHVDTRFCIPHDDNRSVCLRCHSLGVGISIRNILSANGNTFYGRRHQGRKSMQISLKAYINAKIKMLTEEFLIELTKADIEHMRSLKTEIQVDNFVRKIFIDRL